MAYHLHDGTPAPKPFKIDTEPPSRASPAPLSAPLLTPTSRLYMLGKSQTGLSDLDLLRSSLSASSEGMALALSPVRSNSLSVLFGDPEPSQMVESASAAPAAPAYMLSDRTSSEVSIVHNPPFLSGLSQPELIPGALGAWMNDSDSVSQAETAVTDPIELPPLPTEYSTGEGQPQAEATGLPLLLQHVVSNPETGAQTVELVLYDPVSGNCVVVPPELAAGVKFVQDEALTQSLNLEFPLDGSTNVKVEQGPMLPPIAAPPSLVAPVPMSLPATRRPASPQRPQKQRSKRSRTGMPIPSMDNGGQLYPQSALYEEPASEAGDQLGTTPSFEAFRAAFRNHRSHRGSESLDSTPRTSRTSSMAYDDSGASLPPSRTGSPLGKRAFTATEDREIGSGIQELVIDGTEQVKKPKKLYYCGYEGCERSFTTSGHLSRCVVFWGDLCSRLGIDANACSISCSDTSGSTLATRLLSAPCLTALPPFSAPTI